MALQTIQTLKSPSYGILSLFVAGLFGLTLMYFDEFLFTVPYLTFYLPIEKIGNFALDIVLALLTGVVMAISLYQIKIVGTRKNAGSKVGLSGIFAALVAGACPCYYLVPLLSIAGGLGGILGAVGTAFYALQLPVKLASLGLLGFVTYSLEKSLTAACYVGTKS